MFITISVLVFGSLIHTATIAEYDLHGEQYTMSYDCIIYYYYETIILWIILFLYDHIMTIYD